MRLAIVLALYSFNAIYAPNQASIALTLPVLILVLVGLGKIRSPNLQIGDMFWFCVFIFFAISPLQRMGDGTIGGDWTVTRHAYDAAEYITAMAIVVVFLLPFGFISMEAKDPDTTTATPPAEWMLALNILAFSLFVVLQGGWQQVLLPRLDKTWSEASALSEAFLALQTVTTAVLVANARAAGRTWSLVTLVAVAIGLLAITRNPFNASRFSLLAAWVPVGLAMLRGRLQAAWFYAVALFALLVLFPILSITTRLGLVGLGQVEDIDFADNLLSTPFVDIFDTTVHAVRFMSTHDWMLGEKLLAVGLFFVPRALWPNKPIVGGLDIGGDLLNGGMAGTDNLSFFIGADAYMDFGFVGVVMGGLLLALFTAQASASRLGSFYGVSLLHAVIIASLPIMLRGPVGAVLPLAACQIVILIILSRTEWRQPLPEPAGDRL
ncbi:hypothetical protein [Devosia epidermidihirudinis]|nr:hypothetical protein [Devosia epidermidihirudinis]